MDGLATARTFRTTYRNDYCALIHDCIDWRDDKPTPYQDEILSEFTRQRKVAVRSPHGAGKTAVASWIILSFILTNEQYDWKVVTTASAWRQLTKYLWPEIHKWVRRIIWGKIGRPAFQTDKELLNLSIKLEKGEAFAVASDKSGLIEGAHADKLLYVYDEAKAIPDSTWDAAEGAFAGGDCWALSISTPGERSGRFYDIHRRAAGTDNWWTRHIRKDEAIRAGRMSEDWARNMANLWGEDSALYQAKVLGEFPEQSADQLISLAWIESARERELREEGQPQAGGDVAYEGDDDSVWLGRCGPVVTGIVSVHGHDEMEVAGLFKSKKIPVNVDAIGIGSGVASRLIELGFDCSRIKVSENANDKENFINKRAEGFWGLRTRFKDGDIDLSRLSKDQYDRLCGELTSIKYGHNSRGQIKIEEKKEMKKRLGRSPDFADALMLAFINDGAVAPAGVTIEPQSPLSKRRYR